MALVLADSGAAMQLAALLNNTWPVSKNLTMKLFTNNYTPLSTSTAGNFTEATGGGYASVALANGSWTVSLLNSIEQAAYAQQTFGFTGALTTNPTIYGYFVVDGSSNLTWAELLPTPFTPANNGDQLLITPIFQLSHGTPVA